MIDGTGCAGAFAGFAAFGLAVAVTSRGLANA
jgi:hypothetical protein